MKFDQQSVASYYSNKTMNKDLEQPTKQITAEMVTRQSMKQDVKQILELDLQNQRITEIEAKNKVLTQMNATLRQLSLSFNFIQSFENVDILTNLRELDLSFNQIADVQQLPKLPNLRIINLDFNKITKIANIKGLRKLESLSIQGNLIDEFESLEFLDPMIELKELNLSQNKIKHVKQVKNMPNLEKLNLSENPLCLIFPDAFTQINQLGTLMLDSTAFQNPEQDLEFLKNQESNLIMLSINRAFPRQNIHTIEYLSFLKMGRCLTLHLQGLGLASLQNIHLIVPNLQSLDIKDNNINSIEDIDNIKQLVELAEISFDDNPICIHQNINQLVEEACPNIETINEKVIRDAGSKYKEQKEKIMRQLQGQYYKKGEEPTEGDDLLLQDKIDKGQKNESDDEQIVDQNGQVNLNQVLKKQREYNLVLKKAQEEKQKQSAGLNNFERNMGLRLQTLNEDSNSDHDFKNDPLKDIQLFREKSRKTFMDLKKKHRDVMGSLRMREVDTIHRIASQKPSNFRDNTSVNAYDRINQKVSQLKQKILKSQRSELDIRQHARSQMIDKKALTLRDFYSAKGFDSDDQNMSDDSDNSQTNRFDKTARDIDAKSTLNKGQRLLYENQLKKSQAARQSKMNTTLNGSFLGQPMNASSKQSLGDQTSRQSKDFIIRVKGTPTNQSRSKMAEDNGQYHLKNNEKKMLNQSNAHNLKGQNEVIQRMIDRTGKSVVSKNDFKDTLSMSSFGKDSIAGSTPKIVRSVRRNSQSRVIDKEMVLPDDQLLHKKIGNAFQNQKDMQNKSILSMLPPTGQGLRNKNLKQDSKTSLLRKSRADSMTNTSQIQTQNETQKNNTSKSPTKKRNSSEDSNGSISSTEIDFSKHVPIYKQFDVQGKRIMKVEDDPVVSRASSRMNKLANSSSKRKKQPEEVPEYKSNFIAAFFDQAEEQIVEQQQQIMRDKLMAKLNAAQAPKNMPKSILKKPLVDPNAITSNLPQSKSKGFRVQPMTFGEEESQIQEMQKLSEEQESKLAQERITDGVQKAREAVNAPSMDLLKFEQQLKAKHNEFKEQNFVPRLRVNFKGQIIKKKAQK